MDLQFATCERKRALGFLQKLYPGSDITDTPESANAILDITEKDIIRIPDPYFHGQRAAIFPSYNWDKSKKDEYTKIVQEFHDKYK